MQQVSNLEALRWGKVSLELQRAEDQGHMPSSLTESIHDVQLQREMMVTQAKAAAWNLHSVPQSMAAENCSCCMLNSGSLAVLRAASSHLSASQEPFSRVGGLLNTAFADNSTQKAACLWSEKGVAMPRLPLLPVAYFGMLLQKPLNAGFEAYNDIQTLLGPKLKWKLSP